MTNTPKIATRTTKPDFKKIKPKVLKLHKVGELSKTEIADKFGISVSTVREWILKDAGLFNTSKKGPVIAPVETEDDFPILDELETAEDIERIRYNIDLAKKLSEAVAEIELLNLTLASKLIQNYKLENEIQHLKWEIESLSRSK